MSEKENQAIMLSLCTAYNMIKIEYKFLNSKYDKQNQVYLPVTSYYELPGHSKEQFFVYLPFFITSI